MKRLMLLILLVSVGASNATGSGGYGGYIGVYSDQAGTNCNITDSNGRYTYVYILHMSIGSTGSKFKLIRPAGWTYLFGSRDLSFLQTGFPDEPNGVTYSYETCQTGRFWLQTLIYTADGSSPTCSCTIGIVESPSAASGSVEWTDCSGKTFPLESNFTVVNADGTCSCYDCYETTYWDPVESSTWGQIKAS